MPELHTNGNYEAYVAQLLNPAVAGNPFNPAAFNLAANGATGAGYGFGNGQSPALLQQNPWAQQGLAPSNGVWPQQQMGNHAQSLIAIQAAQQIAARHAVYALQCAQALQQIAHHLMAQQWTQQGMAGLQQPGQSQFGQSQFGPQFGVGPIGPAIPPIYGWGQQNPFAPGGQQFAQYLANQQMPQQFRYGLVA